MTSQQAREILLLYRPGSADAEDPDVAQALELARRDPELGQWFAQQCALQAAMRARLRQIPVPEGLREQIVSEVRAQVRSRQRNRMALVATAIAVAVLVVGVALFWTPSPPGNSLEVFRSRMVRKALSPYVMDVETNDLTQIRRYLADHNGQGNAEIPPGVRAAEPTGCALFTFQGDPVSMYCFGKGGQSDLWLFVVNSSTLADPPPDATPRFQQVNRLTTASWNRNGLTYVLAVAGSRADLQRLF